MCIKYNKLEFEKFFVLYYGGSKSTVEELKAKTRREPKVGILWQSLL
jgi:hypothetical protein